MKRIATAIWKGGPGAGEGTISTASGVVDRLIYTEGTSAFDIPCTNPTEMLAAAQAACVSIMVIKELDRTDIHPEHIESRAEVTIEKTREGITITGVHLKVRAFVDGVNESDFHKAVERAKSNCPITKALKPDVTMEIAIEPARTLAAK